MLIKKRLERKPWPIYFGRGGMLADSDYGFCSRYSCAHPCFVTLIHCWVDELCNGILFLGNMIGCVSEDSL